eukprot:291410-Hanusia_phi.AAC.5
MAFRGCEYVSTAEVSSNGVPPARVLVIASIEQCIVLQMVGHGTKTPRGHPTPPNPSNGGFKGG